MFISHITYYNMHVSGSEIEIYNNKAEFISAGKPNSVISLVDTTFDGMKAQRYDEAGKSVLDWPCMEIKEILTNKVYIDTHYIFFKHVQLAIFYIYIYIYIYIIYIIYI
jgi:hypothetical protein